LIPVSISRFGVVPGGEEAPSDHYGIIAEYPGPGGGSPGTGGPAPNREPGPGDIVRYASQGSTLVGDWRLVSDSAAARGWSVENPNRGAAKLAAPLAAPADYFETTFYAESGRPYRLWIRGKAAGNAYANDSVYVQFSGSVTSSGAATWRIATTSATSVVIEDCSGCGLAGWGWADNGYGTLGPVVYFTQTGAQRMRIQRREDGIAIDQIVLSPQLFLTQAPGATKNDGTIMFPTP
jgi:hypothetical protein